MLITKWITIETNDPEELKKIIWDQEKEKADLLKYVELTSRLKDRLNLPLNDAEIALNKVNLNNMFLDLDELQALKTDLENIVTVIRRELY